MAKGKRRAPQTAAATKKTSKKGGKGTGKCMALTMKFAPKIVEKLTVLAKEKNIRGGARGYINLQVKNALA